MILYHRRKDNSELMLTAMINTRGEYQVAEFTFNREGETSYTPISDQGWIPTGKINKNDSTNRLKVTRDKSGEFTFSINEEKLCSFEHAISTGITYDLGLIVVQTPKENDSVELVFELPKTMKALSEAG